jgi:hypothetical protein
MTSNLHQSFANPYHPRPLRALREIRNLRAINELVQTVPLAIASFVDVTGFLLFVLLVFSILALNIWGLEGKFHGRCVVANTPEARALQTRGLLQVPRTLCGSSGLWRWPWRLGVGPVRLGGAGFGFQVPV